MAMDIWSPRVILVSVILCSHQHYLRSAFSYRDWLVLMSLPHVALAYLWCKQPVKGLLSDEAVMGLAQCTSPM